MMENARKLNGTAGIILALAVIATAQDSPHPPCLIVRHASAAHQFLVNSANWQYVEGDFPKGMKWKSNVSDRMIRKIKEQGGRVVTIPPNYVTADLEDARKQCAAPAEMK